VSFLTGSQAGLTSNIPGGPVTDINALRSAILPNGRNIARKGRSAQTPCSPQLNRKIIEEVYTPSYDLPTLSSFRFRLTHI
jgi:hypothetical protein